MSKKELPTPLEEAQKHFKASEDLLISGLLLDGVIESERDYVNSGIKAVFDMIITGTLTAPETNWEKLRGKVRGIRGKVKGIME